MSMRSPRVRTITFIPSICSIYFGYPGQNRTSFCYANSSGNLKPFMKFLFVRPGFCLRLPSDSTSRWTPLPLANASYCQGTFGTFTLKSSPMPGAHKKGSRKAPFLFPFYMTIKFSCNTSEGKKITGKKLFSQAG